MQGDREAAAHDDAAEARREAAAIGDDVTPTDAEQAPKTTRDD